MQDLRLQTRDVELGVGSRSRQKEMYTAYAVDILLGRLNLYRISEFVLEAFG